jgi:hypothetical protein
MFVVKKTREVKKKVSSHPLVNERAYPRTELEPGCRLGPSAEYLAQLEDWLVRGRPRLALPLP